LHFINHGYYAINPPATRYPKGWRAREGRTMPLFFIKNNGNYPDA